MSDDDFDDMSEGYPEVRPSYEDIRSGEIVGISAESRLALDDITECKKGSGICPLVQFLVDIKVKWDSRQRDKIPAIADSMLTAERKGCPLTCPEVVDRHLRIIVLLNKGEN